MQTFEDSMSSLLNVALLVQNGFKYDLSIEGMRSQRFSIGVFIFLLIGILVFVGIIVAVIRQNPTHSKIRPGEKVMLGAIIMGVVVAVIFGFMQMVSGVLF